MLSKEAMDRLVDDHLNTIQDKDKPIFKFKIILNDHLEIFFSVSG